MLNLQYLDKKSDETDYGAITPSLYWGIDNRLLLNAWPV